MFKISVSKEAISGMERETFKGKIEVIDHVSDAKRAVEALKKDNITGFDTETRPSFKRGVIHNVALMQLSTHDTCFLFRLNKIGLPSALADFLTDPTFTKIGLSIHDDFCMIHHTSNIQLKGFIDLQNMVGDYHIADISLQKIYAILFQKKISKAQRLTNWEAPSLTISQQQYAALDAWSCIKIYEYLKSGNFIPEQSPYIVHDEEAKG